jgi:MarR family 2-MHQ and catechol resistance regulon transcriptional repressor
MASVPPADEPEAGIEDGPDAPAPKDWPESRERSLRLWIALARCYSTYSKVVADKVQEYGLTTPQFGIIEALYHLGPLSLGQLADKLLVTGGNVTYVMDRLEAQGLVLRERSPQDRRIIRAKLTADGRRLISGVFPGHAEFIEDLANHLEVDEQEALRTLLKKLGRSIQNGGSE